MRKKRKLKESSTFDEDLINLTPLIDVVFVVLVAFILIAPLLETDHVDLATSTIHSDKNVSQTTIILRVKEDDSILLNNRLVTLNELTTLLKQKRKNYPKQIPQLYHDKKACFGTYQSVKNSVEKAGFEQMDVILQPN